MPRTSGRYPHLTFDTPIQRTFATALLRCGVSQHELARRTGVSRTYINELVNGRHNGSLNIWAKLLEAAGIEIGWKLRDDGQQDS